MLKRFVCIMLSLLVMAMPVSITAAEVDAIQSGSIYHTDTDGGPYAGSAGEDYVNSDICFDFGYKNKTAWVSYVVGEAFGSFPSLGRKGYVLKGWYTKKSGGRRLKESDRNEFQDGTTVYARWQKIADMKASFKSASCSKHVISLKWNTIKNAKKYQLCFSQPKSFRVKRTETLKKNTVKIRGGASGTKYYFKVRAGIVDSAGKMRYTKWSSVKGITVK